MIYLYILILFIFIIFAVLYISSLINNIIYKVPQVSTFNSDLKLLEKVFGEYELEGKKIVDLGSGTGKMIRFFEKNYKANAFGFEIDYSNVLISNIIKFIFGYKFTSKKMNYFNVDLSEYDFVYIYLFPILMEKVEEKIWNSAKPGTIIFVNAFKFEKHKPIKVYQKNGKDKIFVYVV